MLVLNQTLIFLILMLVGMYARKKGMLNKEVEAKISAIVVNIAYPAIIYRVSLAPARISARRISSRRFSR